MKLTSIFHFTCTQNLHEVFHKVRILQVTNQNEGNVLVNGKGILDQIFVFPDRFRHNEFVYCDNKYFKFKY